MSTVAASFDVINPATGEVFAQAPETSREQLDAAFAAAAAAQPAWAADPQARTVALLKASKALMDATQEIAPLLVAEQGKPLAEAIEEVQGCSWWIAHHAKLSLPRETIKDDEKVLIEVVQKPIGVVAAITPWNFPLILSGWKIGPALSVGCTMVLKPSPFTPLSTLKMIDVLNTELPPGVLTGVAGGNDLGAWMTTHPLVRKISFTGSIATGKKIAAVAADDLKRVTLELGGNDPAIVLDDADPAAVVDAIAAASFKNAGQICCAIKRVYVPERLYGDVLDGLAARVDQLTVGDGMSGVDMGPINNAPQLARVRELHDAAIADGAVVATQRREVDAGDGYFFAPTVLGNARDGMAIVDEEQFGPVLPVISYTDERAAIAAANATNYGLDGSVWSADADRAAAVAEQLDCGTAWVNTHLINAPYQPFGGRKWSGIGVENGPWGLSMFTEPQVIHRARSPR